MKNQVASRPGRRQILRNLLKGRAWGLLALPRAVLTQALTVRARDENHQVEITIQPLGDASTGAGDAVGQFFSPLEKLIVDAIRAEKLRDRRPLVGKRIATLTGQPYDPKFKAILGNLVDRRVVMHNDGDTDGYSLTAAPRQHTA